MKLLEEMILREGKILPGDILKVGSFLNQQIDTKLLSAMAEEVKNLYKETTVTKILTIESSGIAFAVAAGIAMGVPVIFAKKHQSSNVDGEIYSVPVTSYTHHNTYNAVISKDYLTSEDHVLIVDDFLATGNALIGMIELVRQAGATLAGVAIEIEKGFQGVGDKLRAKGVRIESLALIDSMTDESITFR